MLQGIEWLIEIMRESVCVILKKDYDFIFPISQK
jgi:hypothetical protein